MSTAELDQQPELVPGFLSSLENYFAAKKHWIMMWNRLRDHLGDWTNAQNEFSMDGTLDWDGNPMLFSISKQLGRGVRIIQFDPKDRDNRTDEFITYTDWIGPDGGRIHEVVIACTLTNRNLKKAEEVIKQWIS